MRIGGALARHRQQYRLKYQDRQEAGASRSGAGSRLDAMAITMMKNVVTMMLVVSDTSERGYGSVVVALSGSK